MTSNRSFCLLAFLFLCSASIAEQYETGVLRDSFTAKYARLEEAGSNPALFASNSSKEDLELMFRLLEKATKGTIEITDDDDTVIGASSLILGSTKNPRVIPIFDAFLESPDRRLRETGALAFAHFGGIEVGEKLKRYAFLNQSRFPESEEKKWQEFKYFFNCALVAAPVGSRDGLYRNFLVQLKRDQDMTHLELQKRESELRTIYSTVMEYAPQSREEPSASGSGRTEGLGGDPGKANVESRKAGVSDGVGKRSSSFDLVVVLAVVLGFGLFCIFLFKMKVRRQK
jgi:hypothetical protein